MNPEIKQRYDALPKDIKDALDSVDVATAVQKIAQKYQLQTDQMDSLGVVVTNTLLGYLPTDDLAAEIAGVLNISDKQAIDIATEINLAVFVRIQESLKRMNARYREPERTQLENIPRVQIPKASDVSIASERMRTLAEIENPQATQPIKIKEPEIIIPRGPQRGWESAKQNIANNFVSQKLTQNTNLPAERTTLTITKTQNGKDPYREITN